MTLPDEDGAPGGGVTNFRKLEYGGVWFLMLYQFAKKLGGGGRGRPTLSRDRIGSYYAERRRQPGFTERLRSARDDLAASPHQMVARAQRALPATPGVARPIRFEIENFKALEKITVEMPTAHRSLRAGVSLAPSLLILGENAAGKSSVLEAMTLAMCSDATREDQSADPSRFMLDPELMGSKRGAQRQGSVIVTYQDGSQGALTFGEAGFTQIIHGEDPTAAASRIPVFAYGAYRLFLTDDKRERPSAAIRSLFKSNYVLANPDRWLFKIRGTPLFDEVVRALRSILAIGQSFDSIEPDELGKRCLLVIRTARIEGPPVITKTPLSAVSSGFRAVLGMACDVMRNLAAQQNRLSATLAKTYAVVLVDEVEAHLHPRWKMQIMQGLREALPNVMFIATTHDPLCLRGMDGGEIRVLRRRASDAAGGQLPMVVEQVESLPAIGSLTIEQLLTSDFFQLFSTDDQLVEVGLAGVGDLLASARATDSPTGAQSNDLEAVRRKIREDIAAALPIGSSEVQRLVQEAVEEYLVKRNRTVAGDLRRLKDATRQKIIEALQAG